MISPYLDLAVNFALHRRKVFWVDEALSFMLGHTDVDIPASDLRAPFASFAFVFTDRHLLSLGERLLSRRVSSALRGLILPLDRPTIALDRALLERAELGRRDRASLSLESFAELRRLRSGRLP